MSELFYSLALLACPVGMGAMLWIMMRGNNNQSDRSGAAGSDELTRLRAEVDQLRAAERQATDFGGPEPMGPR